MSPGLAGTPVAVAALAPGFADPVHAAQATFRRLLDAMARPGRVQTLDRASLQGLERTTPMAPATLAVLLALADADTRVWISPEVGRDPHQTDALVAYARFHTGMAVAHDVSSCEFAFALVGAACEDVLCRLNPGSDEAPEDGATLVIEAAGLDALEEPAGAEPPTQRLPGDGVWVRLTGPGIRHAHRLQVAGLDLGFWQQRAAAHLSFPRGIDLVFSCGEQLAALPRSTRVEILGHDRSV
ncbi:phosphonate C-P lyase system protein PhnH [Caldimonas brevitalea]|uniref:Alpha-D-ribose 1-methylphosphonate 5-triphosphate synthase subunit PhnH n=1 Tax=Caldimonas brevitalea TaxID=413882 RepID=A0A0G3BLS8_9BURK|nr:phosphonate C-P lyase system protein PhnH [Caldimonas brevitalea]AKJ30394.1 alpha-D-ribose 1-methylphosphonate 5-triphosphate synthase subunit PhnH [Caldimonas brevitalea]